MLTTARASLFVCVVLLADLATTLTYAQPSAIQNDPVAQLQELAQRDPVALLDQVAAKLEAASNRQLAAANLLSIPRNFVPQGTRSAALEKALLAHLEDWPDQGPVLLVWMGPESRQALDKTLATARLPAHILTIIRNHLRDIDQAFADAKSSDPAIGIRGMNALRGRKLLSRAQIDAARHDPRAQIRVYGLTYTNFADLDDKEITTCVGWFDDPDPAVRRAIWSKAIRHPDLVAAHTKGWNPPLEKRVLQFAATGPEAELVTEFLKRLKWVADAETTQQIETWCRGSNAKEREIGYALLPLHPNDITQATLWHARIGDDPQGHARGHLTILGMAFWIIPPGETPAQREARLAKLREGLALPLGFAYKHAALLQLPVGDLLTLGDLAWADLIASQDPAEKAFETPDMVRRLHGVLTLKEPAATALVWRAWSTRHPVLQKAILQAINRSDPPAGTEAFQLHALTQAIPEDKSVFLQILPRYHAGVGPPPGPIHAACAKIAADTSLDPDVRILALSRLPVFRDALAAPMLAALGDPKLRAKALPLLTTDPQRLSVQVGPVPGPIYTACTNIAGDTSLDSEVRLLALARLPVFRDDFARPMVAALGEPELRAQALQLLDRDPKRLSIEVYPALLPLADDPDPDLSPLAWTQISRVLDSADGARAMREYPQVLKRAVKHVWDPDRRRQETARHIYFRFCPDSGLPMPPGAMTPILLVAGIAVVFMGAALFGLLRRPPRANYPLATGRAFAFANYAAVACGVALAAQFIPDLMTMAAPLARPNRLHIQGEWIVPALRLLLTVLWGLTLAAWGKNLPAGRVLDTVVTAVIASLSLVVVLIAIPLKLSVLLVFGDRAALLAIPLFFEALVLVTGTAFVVFLLRAWLAPRVTTPPPPLPR